MPSGSNHGSDGAGGEFFHPIGEAARLTGVSRGMLRVWERERLISPRRTPGGHRLYSGEDLERLRQIARLRRMERLNAAAIRRELGTVEPSGPAPASDGQPEFGRRLRAVRTARGWSLAEVAERSGLSVSFLLLHPAERPRYVAGRGLVVIEDLIARPGALEAQRIEILPGGGSEEAYAHPGEEFIYVLSGQLAFRIDERESYRLEAGDSLYFRSSRLHRWANDGAAPATVLWINVPVVDQGSAEGGGRATARRRPAGRRRGAQPEQAP